MSLPLATTTCSLYREGNAPPSSPDFAAIPCHVSPVFRRGLHHGRLIEPAQRFTHILLVAPDLDIRDIYDAGALIPGHDPDTVTIPDETGMPYRVIFVERRLRGTAQDHKRVYLARQSPPT